MLLCSLLALLLLLLLLKFGGLGLPGLLHRDPDGHLAIPLQHLLTPTTRLLLPVPEPRLACQANEQDPPPATSQPASQPSLLHTHKPQTCLLYYFSRLLLEVTQVKLPGHSSRGGLI